MAKVKLTITESKCRAGLHREGQKFIIDENICPKICMELWSYAYPYVWALINGATLDDGEGKSKSFDVVCPDEGRVHLHGEVIEEGNEI